MGAIWETFTHCAASWTVFIFYSITFLTLITMAGITYFVTLYFTSLLGTKEWLVFTCLAWRAVCCMQREGLVYVLIAFVHCCMGGVSLRVLYCVAGEVLYCHHALRLHCSCVPVSFSTDQRGVYLHPSDLSVITGLI